MYRNDGAGGTDHSIVAYDGSGSTATSATVAGLEGGRSYSFVVAGVSAAGEGAVSETALEQSTSPGAPSGLASSGRRRAASPGWVRLRRSGEDTVSEYVLYRDNGSGESAAVSTEAYRGADLSAEVSGLLAAAVRTSSR